MTATQTPKRVRAGHVAWVAERLSKRDWRIIEAVNYLHLVSGSQLERLFFQDLQGRSRIVTRSQCISRLVKWRVLQALPRRIGGTLRGSSVAIYALDSVAKRLLLQRKYGDDATIAVRKSTMSSARFVAHIMAATELYVQLSEARRERLVLLRDFRSEPASWWPNGRGGWLKPDAFVVVGNGRVDHLWWLEVDNATESVPTVGKKLRVYVEFVNRGGVGPRNTVPRVLVTVPHERRRSALRTLVEQLPSPARELVHVVTHDQAIPWLIATLR